MLTWICCVVIVFTYFAKVITEISLCAAISAAGEDLS